MNHPIKRTLLALAAAALAHGAAAQDADQRAAAIVAQMTEAEKLQTVFGHFSSEFRDGYKPPKDAIPYTAGFVRGIERLGIPHQWQTDSGIGVSSQHGPNPRVRTSLPSGLATAATWNPALAFAGGAMIGKEARLSGHNVMLAGGVNLMREPRNGRNFEYGGEDPLLAGVMVGEQIRGIQSNHIIASVKHYAFNDQETSRFLVDVKLDDAAARMSDLLAFQLAIEHGQPGTVMCAYNRVNGPYACESDYLINQVLKRDWGYPGFVMSDWGATHSTIPAALAGLDQQSGYPFDKSAYFDGALGEAVENGHVPQARMDDMVRRILRAMFATGVMDHPVSDQSASIDLAAGARASQADAEEAIVLLKNDGALLPLASSIKTIAIIGGHADVGVLSGGGSAQTYPAGESAVPNEGPAYFPGPMVYQPSSPLAALAQRTKARITYIDGKDILAAAKLAEASDVAIIFANQWTAESIDAPTLGLPGTQDALISVVGAANPRTIVVLQTGGPVTMPWLGKVKSVVEAWYPGTRGGEAIARVLSGEVNPSGHLPATFPEAESQLPRKVIDGDPTEKRPPARYTADYNIEGAAVGYKWFEQRGMKPLFAFGHGLSYTSFGMDELAAVARDGALTVSFAVRNTGKRDGKAVPQVYVAPAHGGWEAPKRLAGWDKLALKPGEQQHATLRIDPRLLGVYDSATHGWKIAAGDYIVTLAESAGAAPAARVTVHLDARTLDARGH